ncbi:hypothetical protein [Paenibacillus sp. FJAT-27812]|uniref:hypothetical protein n=1 Tax=Paenibacillus sp. FJAT-27812 TaxID=1684143 RepID=UPI0006A7B093|nr:hypothetical protein [Paenibacillus sp. FJAT-27812]
MWLWLGVIGAWAWVFIVEIPPLFGKRRMKELMLIILIMILATSGSLVFMYMNVPPNPVEWITKIISPYARALYSLMS